MSEVLFSKHAILKSLHSQVLEFAKANLKGRIAIKMHMGEHGSIHYLRPIYAKIVVDALKEANCTPFIFDSPVVYRGERDTVEKYLKTAKSNGYTEDTVGCPIIISDEPKAIDTGFGEMEACAELLEADGMIVLSHFKGHHVTSYGGAIKNISMGAFTAKSKGKQHSHGVEISSLDSCTGCGICIPVCPFNLLSIVDGKISMAGCMGCGACALVCPNNAIKVKDKVLSSVMADVTYNFFKHFPIEKTFFVNVALDIVSKCDCASSGMIDMELTVVAPNLGIFFSKDPVAIDQACVDMAIEKSNGKFKERWKADITLQTTSGHELGLGEIEYNLKSI